MLLSCFSSPNQPPASSLITCTYKIQLFDTSILLNLTWSKALNSHTLTVYSTDIFSFTISLSPSPFSLFRTRPGSKSISLIDTHNPDSTNKLDIYWDFSKAEFHRVNSAEINSSFYLVCTHRGRVVFFIGDRDFKLTRRGDSVESTIVSRREHLFGRRRYSTTARFMDSEHEFEIECGGGTMKVRIDGKSKLVVKRLGWKFRGNERLWIGGLEIYFFWDLFNWVSRDNKDGNAVFVFQVGDGGGISPEMLGPEKKMLSRSWSPAAQGVVLPAPSWSSNVLRWAEESSECANLNSLRSYGGAGGETGDGFSLILYAWKRD